VTEAEWLDCTDPRRMLTFLRGKPSERKLRLFSCACCRRIWPLLSDERSQVAVRVAELYADGGVGGEQLSAAAAGAKASVLAAVHLPHAASAAHRAAYDPKDYPPPYPDAPSVNAFAAAVDAAQAAACADEVWRAGRNRKRAKVSFNRARRDERAAQSQLLRDLLGNPFRPVPVSPVWRRPQVVALAQATYDERLLPSGHLDPARLAVLADALEEAGCSDADLLGHCRGPGPHVRGCWALDLLLGKS
jgi:hypothetical protein